MRLGSKRVLAAFALAVGLAAGPVGAQAPAPGFEPLYERALEALKNKRYEIAVPLLRQALTMNPGSLEVRKFLSVAAFQRGDFKLAAEVAQSYLARASDDEVRLILARSRLQLGDRTEARRLFSAIADNPDSKFRQDARAAIDAIDRMERRAAEDRYYARPEGLNGLVIAGFEYDSNIAQTVDPSTSGASDVNDYRFTATLDANYDFRFGDRFYAGPGFLQISNLHFNEGHRFDLQLYRFSAHGGIVGEGWEGRLGFEYDLVRFGYHTELISRRIAGRYVNIVTPEFIVIALPSVSWDDYPNNRDQDAVKARIELRNRIYVPQIVERAYLKVRYDGVLNETERKTTSRYFYNKFGLGFWTPLPAKGFSLSVDATYEFRKFDEPQPTSRSDRTLDWIATIAYDWTEDFSTEFSVNRIVTNSDVENFDKSQYIAGLRGIFSF